jgi:hypothetical protein
MKNNTFIPNWYIDKRNINRNKKNKICIFILLIINMLLLAFILNISNMTKVAEETQRSENNRSDIIEVSPPNEQSKITLDKYKDLSSFFEENNLIYKNIVITKESLEINIEVKNYEEYIQVIKSIENRYSIKKLTPKINSKENLNFEVVLGV